MSGHAGGIEERFKVGDRVILDQSYPAPIRVVSITRGRMYSGVALPPEEGKFWIKANTPGTITHISKKGYVVEFVGFERKFRYEPVVVDFDHVRALSPLEQLADQLND